MWTNLEDNMISKISKSQKVKYCMISLVGGPWNRQTHGDRRWIRGGQGLWGGGVVLNGAELRLRC